MINPAYEMSADSYRRVVDFIKKVPSVKRLTLEVVDNTFDGEKAEILYDGLKKSNLEEFVLINTARCFDYKRDEMHRFKVNASAIKELPFDTLVLWEYFIV